MRRPVATGAGRRWILASFPADGRVGAVEEFFSVEVPGEGANHGRGARRGSMKIGELARHAGLRASAIRYYEKLGLLAPPHRVGGQRRYPADTLDRVLLIRFASDMGFSLAEIKLFLSGLRDKAPVGPLWKKLAAKKLSEVEDSIARSLRLKALLQNLLHCRCASLKQCVAALGLSENLRFVSGRRS